jgi:peptidylprolyl isomerase
MTAAKHGDTVQVHYTGRLADDTIFDTSRDREPLEFTIGAGQLIAGFEQAVIGMQPGDSRTTSIPADEAYGDHDPEMVLEVARDQLPDGMNPSVGEQYQLRQQDGDTIIVTVTESTSNHVILDANHPLAGQDLTFDIELVEIV